MNDPNELKTDAPDAPNDTPDDTDDIGESGGLMRLDAGRLDQGGE